MSGQDGKPFAMPQELVWQGWKQVKADGGAAGADGVTAGASGTGLKDSLCKVWNRMSPGTYFPPPVRAVEMPGSWGARQCRAGPPRAAGWRRQRPRWRWAPGRGPCSMRTPAAAGPGRGALDAAAACRQRCGARSRVTGPGIRKFSGSVSRDLVIKAVQAGVTHEQRRITLYVRRWLAAPIVMPDGRTAARDKGTPRGQRQVPCSPAYAPGKWPEREFPLAESGRHAGGAVVHRATGQQARRVLAAPEEKMAGAGLQPHPDKTRIVYCKDRNRRRGDCADTSFTFPGCTSRARQGPGPAGRRRDVQRLPASGQQGRPQADERGSPRLAHPHARRHRTGRHRLAGQPRHQGLDDLLRQVLQDRAERPAPAHQHLPGALGEAEVQAAQDIQQGSASGGKG